MGVIEIRDLTFGFDKQLTNLFEHTDLIIDTGWKLGLIGRNGRGKTTFLKLLQGKLPYTGEIIKQTNFVYFPQKVADESLLTVDVLAELSAAEQWRVEKELRLLKVNPDILWRGYGTLSGGEQTKVLLALLFAEEGSFPLIDEPTNHLDVTARKQVADYLKSKSQGFIVVSHDRGFVNEVADHILAIEKSQLVLYQGNFTTYEEQKQLRDEFELAQNAKLKSEISRLKQTAAEKAEWSDSREKDKRNPRKGFIDSDKRGGNSGAVGADAARMMKRSKAIIGRMNRNIEEKEGLLKDIETMDQLTINYQPGYHKQLLKVENLQLSYQDKPLFAPLSFELNQGERLAIQGPNGSGKSSLIHYLLGTFAGEASGTILRPQKLTISYLRQNYEDNRGTLQTFAAEHQLSYQDLLNNLRKLGVERQVFANRIEEMSMGQRKRVEVAKSLATPAELFIWDEPLNYLDVYNQQQLELMIREYQPTMLIVEHDKTFLENVATRIVYLDGVK